MSGYNPNNYNLPYKPQKTNPNTHNIYEIPNTQQPLPGVVPGAIGGGIYPSNIVTPPLTQPQPYFTPQPFPFTAPPPTNPPTNLPYPPYPTSDVSPYYNMGHDPFNQPFPSNNQSGVFRQSDPFGMTPAFLPLPQRPGYFPPAQGSALPHMPNDSSQSYYQPMNSYHPNNFPPPGSYPGYNNSRDPRGNGF